MKHLEIDDMYRQYLVAKRALVLDDEGNETLLGLTVGESVEYLVVMDRADTTKEFVSVADPERMLVLFDRHTASMMNLSSIFDHAPWSYF